MDINRCCKIKNTLPKVERFVLGIQIVALAFICIKVNRVEAVAVVATHAVIRPTPTKMTGREAKSAGAGEDMSKIKPAKKVMLPRDIQGQARRISHIIICMDNLTNNGRCRSEQSYANKAKREYDRSGDESAGVTP